MKSLIKTIRDNPSPIIELLKALRDFDKHWDLSKPVLEEGDTDNRAVEIEVESPRELDASLRRIYLVYSLYSNHKDLK